MRPAESNDYPRSKFHKWQFVKRYASDPKAISWVRKYAGVVEFGGGLKDCDIPRDVWVSLAASTSSSKKAIALAEYLESLITM